MENFKNAQELNVNDVIFIETKDKSCIAEIVNVEISKSGKFNTIWFTKITESDNNYEVGNKAYKNKYGYFVYYVNRKITSLYQLI
jgi:hypothetical protein